MTAEAGPVALIGASENKDLNAIFTALYDSDGSEIYLKPAHDYVALDKQVNFYTIVEAARQRGEIALGIATHLLRKTRRSNTVW